MTDAPGGWINNLKFYQADDRSNDTEWTFETTGGDSWMPLARLKSKLEEYKDVQEADA